MVPVPSGRRSGTSSLYEATDRLNQYQMASSTHAEKYSLPILLMKGALSSCYCIGSNQFRYFSERCCSVMQV